MRPPESHPIGERDGLRQLENCFIFRLITVENDQLFSRYNTNFMMVN
jgi:hypothetical protein